MGYGEKIDEKRNKRGKISRLTTLALIAVMLGSCLFFACGKDKEEASGSKSKIVNLLGKSRLGNRYLKVIMQLEISSEKDKELIDKHKPQMRDVILLFLSNQTFDDVKTAPIKTVAAVKDKQCIRPSNRGTGLFYRVCSAISN